MRRRGRGAVSWRFLQLFFFTFVIAITAGAFLRLHTGRRSQHGPLLLSVHSIAHANRNPAAYPICLRLRSRFRLLTFVTLTHSMARPMATARSGQITTCTCTHATAAAAGVPPQKELRASTRQPRRCEQETSPSGRVAAQAALRWCGSAQSPILKCWGTGGCSSATAEPEHLVVDRGSTQTCTALSELSHDVSAGVSAGASVTETSRASFDFD